MTYRGRTPWLPSPHWGAQTRHTLHVQIDPARPHAMLRHTSPTKSAVFSGTSRVVKADYTVRPTRGADNLFLISRASFSAHSPYAHLDGHHQEGMHAKVTVLKRSPQTFLAGMHAQLRPIGGRSEPDFSLYNDKECESQLLLVHAHGPDRALGLCSNPRSKESKPASKEKVVFLTRSGRPVGEYALCNAAAQGGLALWPCRG